MTLTPATTLPRTDPPQPCHRHRRPLIPKIMPTVPHAGSCGSRSPCGVTYTGGMIAEFALGLPMVGWPLAFFLATYFFGGFFTIRTAISSTLRGKFEVDFLMLVAAVGAALIGRWAEGAVLLFLFSLGHALEEYALSRASKSIEALAELAPAAPWCAAAKPNPWKYRWRSSWSETSLSSVRTPASPRTGS